MIYLNLTTITTAAPAPDSINVHNHKIYYYEYSVTIILSNSCIVGGRERFSSSGRYYCGNAIDTVPQVHGQPTQDVRSQRILVL